MSGSSGARGRLFRGSIVTRTALAFVASAVASVIVVGSALVWIARGALRESAAHSQELSAREVALLVEAYVRGAADALRLYSSLEAIAGQDSKAQKTVLDKLLIYWQPRFIQASVFGADGAERAHSSRLRSRPEGAVGAPLGGEARTALAEGRPYFGQIRFSPDSGILSIDLAVPLYAKGTRVEGALAAELNIHGIWQDVSVVGKSDMGYAYLVDRSGRLLAFREPATVLRRFGEDMRGLPPVADFNRGAPPSARGFYEYAGLKGEEVIGSFSPVAGTPWAVVAELPSEEAYVDIFIMIRTLIVIVLLCATLSSGMSFLLSMRLTAPIGRLALTARELGEGRMDATVPDLDRLDEVGELARSFERMRVDLRRLYRDLATRVAELSEAQEELRSSLGEKETLLKEIHHRVKNNLQIIASLLSLQSEQLRDPVSRGFYEDSMNRVRSMAQIHELLYESESLVSIDLAEHLRRIASDLYQAYRDSFADVRMDIETDRVELGIEQAIPCGLIAGEILSNAFKYAFPRGLREGGTIVVRLRSGADGDVEMHIGDDGVGMPEEIARDQRDRVGLSLIGLLAEQLNAELATGREGGTSYTLRFRVRPVA